MRTYCGLPLKEGDQINHLKMIRYDDKKWLCKCDCGNDIKLKTNSIVSGNTKSCGCLKRAANLNKIEKLISGKRKYAPNISSARRIWKQYCYRDKHCNISFEQFYNVSQMTCFYCGTKPNNTYNAFLTMSSKGSENAKINGTFNYNGLDRIDSSLYHTIDNVVPCCIICNRAKNNSTLSEFYTRISKLRFNKDFIYNTHILPACSYVLTSIKCIFTANYNDGDITIEEFYNISQAPCFYCSEMHSNTFNKANTDKKSSKKAKINGTFNYNGLDRIDSSKPHNKNNVVSCCKYCNFAKGKLSMDQFQTWILDVKQYQKEKAGR